jgi:hypothetical protein
MIWERKSIKSSEEYLFPIASGVIAGGSLMGVALACAENGPELVQEIRRQLFGG